MHAAAAAGRGRAAQPPGDAVRDLAAAALAVAWLVLAAFVAADLSGHHDHLRVALAAWTGGVLTALLLGHRNTHSRWHPTIRRRP